MKVAMMYKKSVLLISFLMVGILTACYESSEFGENNSIKLIEVRAWPGVNIYYHIDESFDRNDENDAYTLKMLRLAMKEWSASANINFIERKVPGDYVCTISKSDSNASTVGYRKDPRIMLKPMASQRQATHELGHLLGFTHEHQRPDRDGYITVRWNWIRPEAAGQYSLVENSLYEAESYPYDYRSVMHYSTSSGAVSIWEKTYIINDETFKDWCPTYLTDTDRARAADIYGPRG